MNQTPEHSNPHTAPTPKDSLRRRAPLATRVLSTLRNVARSARSFQKRLEINFALTVALRSAQPRASVGTDFDNESVTEEYTIKLVQPLIDEEMPIEALDENDQNLLNAEIQQVLGQAVVEIHTLFAQHGHIATVFQAERDGHDMVITTTVDLPNDSVAMDLVESLQNNTCDEMKITAMPTAELG
mgnify:FL=1